MGDRRQHRRLPSPIPSRWRRGFWRRLIAGGRRRCRCSPDFRLGCAPTKFVSDSVWSPLLLFQSCWIKILDRIDPFLSKASCDFFGQKFCDRYAVVPDLRVQCRLYLFHPAKILLDQCVEDFRVGLYSHLRERAEMETPKDVNVLILLVSYCFVHCEKR
jgi:hypothetical protein